MRNNYFFKDQFSNIYKKTSKNLEVTSQILYGEKFKILSKNKKWLKIKTSFDNYIGYVKKINYVNKFNLIILAADEIGKKPIDLTGIMPNHIHECQHIPCIANARLKKIDIQSSCEQVALSIILVYNALLLREVHF